MKNQITIFCSAVFFVFTLVVLPQKAHAAFVQVPFEFDSYSEGDLDWYDYDDDNNTGATPLGFSVTVGGATYDHFDMDSNGYVQLLSGVQSPTNYGYGSIGDLTGDDPTSTYLLAAYDDLDSSYYGFYGYKLFSDRAVFYYDTETYYDGDYDYLNNFEIILNQNGKAQWNFNYADYSGYDYDLFSGIYFGNSGALHELYSGYIPSEESWIYNEDTQSVVPEPATMSLLGLGLLGLFGLRKKRS